jgi:septal ring factor EnvC (AmiA/AmiB activator)
VLSGTQENANNHFTQYVAGEMSVPTQRTNPLSTPPKSTTQADTQLFFAREEIARLKQEFGDLQLQNISLTSQFYEATKKFYDASVTIQQLEFKLKQLEKPNADES